MSFAADGVVQPIALGLAALVAPDECRAEDVAIGIDHDAAVHLASESDGEFMAKQGLGVRRPACGFWCKDFEYLGMEIASV